MGNAIVVRGEPVYVGREVRVWTEHGMHFDGLGRRTETRAVVQHWTGGEGDARQVFRTLRTRKPVPLSAHFFVDAAGVIWQFSDADDRCLHAGIANGWSVGIEYQNRGNANAEERGVRREVIVERIHGHEAKRTTMLVEQTASGIALTDALLRAYGLPWAVPMDGADVASTFLPRAALDSWRGILGHLHLTDRKVDPGLTLLRALAAHPTRQSDPDLRGAV